jgi:catechol 2,3-dioxygenase-like lactoylglutathione lyase family enzyme
MSTTKQHNLRSGARLGEVDMRFEVDVIPVSDVERSKEFYRSLGWRLDDDVSPLDGLRIVQFTPPGSRASITFGTGISTASPGSAEATVTVTDIEAAQEELLRRGIDVSDIWHGPPFPVEARQPGPDPKRASYGSFCAFTDPDNNLWLVQEVTTRLPGRVNPAETTFASAEDLAKALERAEAAHDAPASAPSARVHPRSDSIRGEDWAAWYASYIVAEQAGSNGPS